MCRDFHPDFTIRYNDSGPLTAATHFTIGHDGIRTYHMIIGGAEITVQFPLASLFSLEERTNGPDSAEVSIKLNPAAVIFLPNQSVTDWKPINKQFPGLHITQGAVVDWDVKQTLTRLRLRANVTEAGSKPVLLLEALVLNEGTWEGVPKTKQETLSSDSSSAIRLWGSQDCTWYSPLHHHKLPTVPGLLKVSIDIPAPSEMEYRWYLQAILLRCDRGRSVESRHEYEAYMASPYPTTPTAGTSCYLPYPFNKEAAEPQGRPSLAKHQFSRNGKVISRNKSKPYPQPNSLAKFNLSLKGVGLSQTALPADAPVYLQNVASQMFNASIAAASARAYSSAASHVTRLEAELGRQFLWPLSAQDSNLLLVHLLSKGLKTSTVRSYLAGVRRLSLSHGVSSPTPQSDLAKSLLKGHENLARNPIQAVAEATHRPVSIPFLRLLGHAMNRFWKGNLNDKQCFWSISLFGFWGSMRIGEILCKETASFSPTSNLLGTDVIHMSPSSLALWVRDPKIPKTFGDVVEVWTTPSFPDVDPFKAFLTYWELRKKSPLSLPLFLKADGRIFTHSLFSSTLKALLSQYTLELELSVNTWTGHSFRSGLPTLLQSAGFSDDEIKVWGRWVSTAFQLYTRDIAKRSEVQRSITKVMEKLKAYIEGG